MHKRIQLFLAIAATAALSQTALATPVMVQYTGVSPSAGKVTIQSPQHGPLTAVAGVYQIIVGKTESNPGTLLDAFCIDLGHLGGGKK